MITLYPPYPSKFPQRIKLATGATVFPDPVDFGSVRVPDESEAIELESLGWNRDKASRQAKAAAAELLQKGMITGIMRNTPNGIGSPIAKRVTAKQMPSDSELLKRGLARQLEREPHSIGSAEPHPRTEFGDVMTPLGRVMVAYDRGADVLSVHGANVLMSDIGRDLRQALVATSAAFSAAFSAEEQIQQKTIVSLIVGAVMRENPTLEAEVKRRLTSQRYD